MILQKIKNQWFRECVVAFWAYNIKPHINYEKMSTEDVQGFPILRNGIFKIITHKEKAEQIWNHPLLRRLGDLLDTTTKKLFTDKQFKKMITEIFRPEADAENQQIINRACGQYKRIVSAMPTELKTLLETPYTKFEAGEIVIYTENKRQIPPKYGEVHPTKKNVINTLAIDSSGYANKTGEKKITNYMYNNMDRATIWEGKEKKRNPIMRAPKKLQYPLNGKWVAGKSKDPLLLSQLTIKRLTTLLPKPPFKINSEKFYNEACGETLPWKKIHANQRGYLTTPRDGRVAKKMIYKKLSLELRTLKQKTKSAASAISVAKQSTTWSNVAKPASSAGSQSAS